MKMYHQKDKLSFIDKICVSVMGGQVLTSMVNIYLQKNPIDRPLIFLVKDYYNV